MGTATIRRHYAGYDSRQMGRIEDQPRERILEAYYAERDRVKRLESDLLALGKPVPPRDADAVAATGDASIGTNAQPNFTAVPSLEEWLAAGYTEEAYHRQFGEAPAVGQPVAHLEPEDQRTNDFAGMTPEQRREAEELERVRREARYPLDANAGNETNRLLELLPGQDPTDAEPSKSVSLTPEKGENMDHPIDPAVLEESKKPIVENTTTGGRRKK